MSLSAGMRLGPYEILGLVGSEGWGRSAERATRGRGATSRSSDRGGRGGERGAAAAVRGRGAGGGVAVAPERARGLRRGGAGAGAVRRLRASGRRDPTGTLRGGPLPLRSAVDLAVQVCRGLQAAHARGILGLEARERVPDAGRLREGPGLRAGEAHSRGCDRDRARDRAEPSHGAPLGVWSFPGERLVRTIDHAPSFCQVHGEHLVSGIARLHALPCESRRGLDGPRGGC